mgnify:FL=1
MNNNETNYEFVDRDYDSVVNGNEKKIQFYSRTFDAIHDKYKKWRQNKLKRSIVNTENQIYSNTNILNKVYLSEHSQDKIKRKLEHLQDKVEYLNLALEDENYLHVSVRLLKVAERARNNISRWWKDFIKNVPIVGKMYQQKIAANDEPSNVQDNINVDDIISPQTVEEMINKQFATDDNKEQKQNSNINQEDATYRLGRDELANMPGRIDVINPTNDNQTSTDNSQVENDSNINQEDTTYRLGRDELTNISGRIDAINPTNDNQTSTDNSQVKNNDNNEIETGVSIISAEPNTSLIIPNEFVMPSEQYDSKPNENVQNNFETNTNSNSSINNNSDIITTINDQDTIAALEQYREILKKQIEKKKQMTLEKEKAQHEYEQAQEKNNKVRDENNYLKEMISTRLNLMEESLNEESQKTQAELNLMCDKTNKLNSSTNQLDQANESLKAMCDELNIGVQENANNNSKGRSK